MSLVVKLKNSRNEEQFWELLKVAKPLFDPFNDWWLVTQPINGKPKQIQWINPRKEAILWVKTFFEEEE